MNVRHPLSIFTAASFVLTIGGCGNVQFTHVKPGQSARMAVLIQTAPVAKQRELLAKAGIPTGKSSGHYAAIEALALDVPAPGLPDVNPPDAQAAELYARSGTAVQAGQTGEAILALEEAVHIDPTFTDAWSQLANLYQNAGQGTKANEASKKARDLAQSKGPDVLIPGKVPELNP
jgi:tetratricopeptide (TPR) repeat protein